MEKEIFKALWNKAETAYKKGTSESITVLTEDKFDEFIQDIVKICNIADVSGMLPTCTNCGKKMKIYAYECKCGMTKLAE